MNDNVYIAHHGILGQKWGVRRYQNADGTLTAAGKKRYYQDQEKSVASDKRSVISKGTRLYRVSSNEGSDAESQKIYLNASKKAGDYFMTTLGSNKIYENGKAFAHEYIAQTDLVLPSKKVMEKIELGLLKDAEVRRELVDALMGNGMTREAATKAVEPWTTGKAFMERLKNAGVGAAIGAAYGAEVGMMSLNVPVAALVTGSGAALGGALGLAVGGAARNEKLNTIRKGYGDEKNVKMNSALEKALADQGYNAMKDYNDRRAFGENGKHAIIAFNGKNNLSLDKSINVKAAEYGEAYARNYLNQHPGSKLSFTDLVKDGEKQYQSYYDNGVVNRARKAERQKLLDEAKKKEESK